MHSRRRLTEAVHHQRHVVEAHEAVHILPWLLVHSRRRRRRRRHLLLLLLLLLRRRRRPLRRLRRLLLFFQLLLPLRCEQRLHHLLLLLAPLLPLLSLPARRTACSRLLLALLLAPQRMGHLLLLLAPPPPLLLLVHLRLHEIPRSLVPFIRGCLLLPPAALRRRRRRCIAQSACRLPQLLLLQQGRVRVSASPLGRARLGCFSGAVARQVDNVRVVGGRQRRRRGRRPPPVSSWAVRLACITPGVPPPPPGVGRLQGGAGGREGALGFSVALALGCLSAPGSGWDDAPAPPHRAG